MLRFFISALLALATAIVPSAAHAQAWPARPVNLIVASAAGAGVDGFARLLADRMAARLGQPVVVDNRPGASGMIAAGVASRAAPNGYTLFLLTETLIIAPHVLSKQAQTINVITEFTPVILAVSTFFVLAVSPKIGVSSVQELVAYAKRKPGTPYAAGLTASPMHVLGEQFRKATGADLVFVPYKSVAQMLAAGMGGQVDILWVPASSNLQHFKAGGSLKALATASPARPPMLADVPTMVELGYKDIEATSWMGILAPAATPGDVVGTINRAVNAVLAEPAMREQLVSRGNMPEGGEPEVFGDRMRRYDAHYRKLAAELRISAD